MRFFCLHLRFKNTIQFSYMLYITFSYWSINYYSIIIQFRSKKYKDFQRLMCRQFYVQKLPNVAETRGDKPTGDISGGSLGSPSWTQFTYFDLIGPMYDSTPYIHVHVARREAEKE